MPSPDNPSPENRRIDWWGIARTLLAQVLVLLVLSAAFVRYAEWSSDRAWAEFTAAGQSAAAAPVQSISGRAPCGWRI